MEVSETKFRISIGSFALEIVGPEAYVNTQVELFRPVILSQLSNGIASEPESSRTNPAPEPVPDATPTPTTSVAGSPYPMAMRWDGTRTTLQMNGAPGKTTQDKMRNVILLYVLAKKLQGVDSVSAKELRDVCREHKCLDDSHFSRAYKDKTVFYLSGTPRDQQVSLNDRGITKARELAQSLNDQLV
jgi:hypothetical protein